MEDKSLNILICDDSILSRRQMKNMLTSITNCNIIEAENGEVAVRKQGEGDKGTMKIEEFAKNIAEEVHNMINKW